MGFRLSFLQSALGLGALVWLGLFAPLWRRLTRAEVMPVVLFMLGVNAVGVAMLAPMVLATALALTLHLLGLVPKDILKALLYA